MLTIRILLGPEEWDEAAQEFVEPESVTIDLEHSLASLSKWESKWCKSFLSKQEKTLEETIDYIKCMTLTPNVDPEIYNYLSDSNIVDINQYIESPMSATYFYDEKNSGSSKETITSELIYYWMIASNIPFECQYWHLNRLLTLIKVCSKKNAPPKKMSRSEIMSRNRALNNARRQQYNTKG